MDIKPIERATRYSTERDHRRPLAEHGARSAKDLAAGAVASATAEHRMGEYATFDGMVTNYLDVPAGARYPLTGSERAELGRAAA